MPTQSEINAAAPAMFKVDWPKDNWDRLGEGSYHQARYLKMACVALAAAEGVRGLDDQRLNLPKTNVLRYCVDGD